MQNYKQYAELETPSYGGANTALQFSLVPRSQSPRMQNAYMDEDGDISQRPGTVPVTTVALGVDIKYLTEYRFPNSVAVGAAPTVSAVGNAASTLPAGTYYSRYTYVTDVGETEASAEASVVVPPAVANPTVVPILAQSADGGETLPDVACFVAYTWKNAVGETMVSGESTITITAGNRLDITIPALPAGATSASIYAGTTTGVLKFQANILITTHAINAPILTVTAPPVANTCIVANLRVAVPAIPYHANSINIYISTTSNTETKQVNTTNVTYNQSIALVAGAAYPTINTTDFDAEILAASGTALYGLYNGELRSATMTDALESSDIYTVGFTNTALDSILFIADGGDLKSYNGSVVADITPAADDAGPAPPNGMAAINLLNPIYTNVHKGHLFVSDGKDVWYFSKLYEFDYFPTTFYRRWVRDNDFTTGCGITFDNVMVFPMRHGWAIMTGEDDGTFEGNQFLNTSNGNIAPRSPAEITYPDGSQTIAYLSDNEVHEIFATIVEGTSRTYSTRSLMQGKINFTALGLTEAEKTAAVGVFHPDKFLYLLSFKKSGTNYTYAYDTRNREWYTDWLTFNAQAYLSLGDILYFGGSLRLLQKFDDDLYDDWNESSMTTGTIVFYRRYTPALYFEFSGFPSMWDAYLLESQQWYVPSTLDITFIFSSNLDEMERVIKGEVFVEGVSEWGYAKYANLNFTDLVNEPNEILFEYARLSKYVQVLVESPRSEPVKIFKEKFKGRVSGK